MSSISNVVSEHAEEAAFLWHLRDGAVTAPDYTMDDLAQLDGRVEAHLDALRIAGCAGWEVCKEAAAWQEGGELFAATVLALESGDRSRVRTVVEMGTSNRHAIRGMVSAFGWLRYEQVVGVIDEMAASSSAEVRRLGIAAGTAHRLAPPLALEQGLRSQDAHLRERAIRASGQLGAVHLLPVLSRGLDDEDPHCRFSAALSASLLGCPRAVETLRSIGEDPGPDREAAVLSALRQMSVSEANAWQRDLATAEGARRLAVIAAGVVGDPIALPWLLKQMDCPELARVAGEAVTSITGVDLEMAGLRGAPPKGFACGPTDDPDDPDVTMDPDEGLPWPDPLLLDRWLRMHRCRYETGRRYLAGSPIAKHSLEAALRNGTQRQRAAAALELALLSPEQPLFEVRAPGFRQQVTLAARSEQR
jgi:uncharacterized protein (TIGR02270 family)